MNINRLSLAVVLSSVALFALPGSPVRAQSPLAAPSARVIVKYKADSPLLRREALGAGRERLTGREALGKRVGLSLRAGADVGERTQVLFASGMTSRQLASRLAVESDIEFAVPDERRRPLAAPNDPLYFTGPPITGNSGGPVSGQWYLRAPTTEARASINAETAWNYTFGSPSVVVAMLDTGVRFDHPDLMRVGSGGNLLPGYDLITDVDVANDGDGRDPDPSDPGDWLTQAEVTENGGPFEDCAAENSSWHGTQTTGLIAALTGNGIGMASVGRNVRVLPVRVLGKCGGFDSDIIAGLRWAVGMSVAGAPVNPNPARVINMSLGGEGACHQAYINVLSELAALGVVVVASAGNTAGHVVTTPANCPGVIAVAGLRHAGTKVGISDLGPEIAISAPSGNCVDVGPNDPCRYPILTTSNAGATIPIPHAGGGSIYTDAFNASIGTSFAAPLVAGTAALMLSVQPGLSASSVRALLQSSARPFPTSGAEDGGAPLPQCTIPQFIEGSPVDQLQCYCTTAVCGAGMLDAGAAVSAALGLQAHIAVTPANPVAGQVVTLSAASSVAANGRFIVAYQWEIVEAGGIVTGFLGSANGVTASMQPVGAGRFSVKLTVADNLGLSATTVTVIDVGAGGAPLNFQGMWWNAPAGSEDGWGINFAHQGEVIFATWFTHDANGQAWYMSMTAFKTGPNTFTGTLYRTTGPSLGAPFDPNQVQRIEVGSGTLSFADGNNGTFAYTVNGIAQTKAITRQVFGPLPTCTWGGLSNLALATNYQDLWWNAPAGSEDGWGINFTHQGDVIFATWFTYDFTGAALPLSATLLRVGPGVYSGTLIKTSGPAFSAVPFASSAVMRAEVGTATVSFSNGNAATFSYQVSLGGQSVNRTKAIERQVFRAPGTVCR